MRSAQAKFSGDFSPPRFSDPIVGPISHGDYYSSHHPTSVFWGKLHPGFSLPPFEVLHKQKSQVFFFNCGKMHITNVLNSHFRGIKDIHAAAQPSPPAPSVALAIFPNSVPMNTHCPPSPWPRPSALCLSERHGPRRLVHVGPCCLYPFASGFSPSFLVTSHASRSLPRCGLCQNVPPLSGPRMVPHGKRPQGARPSLCPRSHVHFLLIKD